MGIDWNFQGADFKFKLSNWFPRRRRQDSCPYCCYGTRPSDTRLTTLSSRFIMSEYTWPIWANTAGTGNSQQKQQNGRSDLQKIASFGCASEWKRRKFVTLCRKSSRSRVRVVSTGNSSKILRTRVLYLYLIIRLMLTYQQKIKRPTLRCICVPVWATNLFWEIWCYIINDN